MHQHQEPRNDAYPLGRGHGHDYMRGGEVLGGYGYSDREDYDKPRGEAKPRDDERGSGDDRRT